MSTGKAKNQILVNVKSESIIQLVGLKKGKEILQQKPCIVNRGRMYLNKTSFEVDRFKRKDTHYRLS